MSILRDQLFFGDKIVRHNLIPLALFLIFASHISSAQTFTSTEQQVPLIELYTSEGCSSCPPADRYLSQLSDEKGLWEEFVPIAFHVDYWDYIGWKDPYASKEYSQRQRRYAAEYRETTVYTPGLRKAGEEWRSWRIFGNPRLDSDEAGNPGVLKIAVNNDGLFEADFTAQDTSESVQLTVALLGLNLSNEVTRGENRGKTLEHDFVVLGISTYSSANSGEWSGQLPAASVDAPNYAIAAWVTQGGSLVPIQATGGLISIDQSQPLAKN